MKKLVLSLLLGILSLSITAQITLNVQTIPANTPMGDPIYVVGNFNNWDPADPNMVLTAAGNGSYTLVIYPDPGLVEFKFTRGNWDKVEGNANGGYLPNRTFNYDGQAVSIDIHILSWEDLSPVGGTAADNVFILDPNFYMPELQRNRRIWIYLPPDYQSSNKFYPVMYMHDGQNLFDASTSAFGEWEVDESLNELFAQGDYGCIVVGIDNGESHRLDEYSPWINPDYGGGEGEAYINFVLNTLKPHIDSSFRTLPGRNTTAIMGSSMGGLISMYALAEHQDKISKAGIFSPAFWFAGSAPADHVTSSGKQADVRVFFLAGGDEPASVTTNLNTVADAMLSVGFGTDEQFRQLPADGEHSEWFWRREFPAAYQWLFAGGISKSKQATPSAKLRIIPNPAGDWVQLAGLPANKKSQVQIYTMDGKLMQDTTIYGNQALNTSMLPPGQYSLRARQGKGKWIQGRLVRK
ncbi:MAG: alpha/beta hydrolase-fold protein [Saprospiraceae bacterium]